MDGLCRVGTFDILLKEVALSVKLIISLQQMTAMIYFFLNKMSSSDGFIQDEDI